VLGSLDFPKLKKKYFKTLYAKLLQQRAAGIPIPDFNCLAIKLSQDSRIQMMACFGDFRCQFKIFQETVLF